MLTSVKKLVFGLTATLLLSGAAIAAPTLKSNVVVSSNIVTVGDMFDNAGNLAETGLFRSPAPGTVGTVPLASISLAAQRAGLTDFTTNGIIQVRVERPGVAINQDFLSGMFTSELLDRNQLQPEQTIQFTTYGAYQPLFAALSSSTPATLLDFNFTPETGRIEARLSLSGLSSTINIVGRGEILAPAAHLVRTMSNGEIIGAEDIKFDIAPLRFSKAQGELDASDLVGKSLTRSIQGGSLLRLSDFREPTVINRNEMVTLYFKQGPLELSVKGRALQSATKGQAVSVLNLMSKKTVEGIATGTGKVLVSNDATRVASR